MPEPNNEANTPDPITLKRALDQIREELARIPTNELMEVRSVEPAAAAGVVIGNLNRIHEHRAAIAAQFGDVGVAFLDRVATAAYATTQSSIEFVAADPASDLTGLHREVMEAHSLLYTDATALVNRKLLERDRVEAGRGIQGHRAAVQSVLVLVSLFRASWSKVSASTPLEVTDLDAAEAVAQRMIEKLSTREQGSGRMPELDTRNRAFTNLVRVYGEVRRMLGYLRYWDGDADAIAPSLWSGRRRSRSGTPAEDVTDPLVANEPTTPAPEPITPVSPAEPGSPGEPFVA